MLRALQRYIDEHDAKERQGGFVPDWKNGDTFFNKGYVDYLDGNFVTAPREPPRPAATCSGFVNYEQSNTDWEAAFEKGRSLSHAGGTQKENRPRRTDPE